jgi:hypothetical protein
VSGASNLSMMICSYLRADAICSASQTHCGHMTGRGEHQIVVRPGNLELVDGQQRRYVAPPVVAHDKAAAAQGNLREQPPVELGDFHVALQLFAEITFDFLFQPRGADGVPDPPCRGEGDPNGENRDSDHDGSAARRLFVHINHRATI